MNRLFLLIIGLMTTLAHAQIPGCMDSTACNFDADATSDDGSCTFAAYGQDCNGNCVGGTTWYVDGNTAFTDPDGSEPQPFSTVQAGIDAACSGDTVLIAPGQYVENISLIVSNIVLSGYDPDLPNEEVAENVILDGDELGTTLFVSGDHAVIEHLTIQNGKSGYGAGLYLNGAHHSVVRNCIIRDNVGTGDITAHGIALNASNCVIEDCLVTGNYGRKHTVNAGGSNNIIRNCRIVDNNAWETGGGIVVYTDEMLIENCLIADNNGGGITTYRDNTVVDHCTVTGNSGFGFFIWCYSNNADFWITNSVSSNNGNQEFKMLQTGNLVGTAHLRSTLVEGGVDYDWQSVYKVFDSDSTFIEQPPLLLEDRSLSSLSPAIGSGSAWRFGFDGEQNIPSVVVDLVGVNRPLPAGTVPDLGCYENAFGTPEPFPGCTDSSACNFNPAATEDDGSCIAPTCDDPLACNFDPAAICGGGQCITSGCMEPLACNYNALAECEGEACSYTCCPGPGCCLDGTTWDAGLGGCVSIEISTNSCAHDINFDGVIGVVDLMDLLSLFGENCE